MFLYMNLMVTINKKSAIDTININRNNPKIPQKMITKREEGKRRQKQRTTETPINCFKCKCR